MFTYKRYFLLVIILILTNLLFAQQNTIQKRIYFETGKHEINIASQKSLNFLIDSLKKSDSFFIYLRGNTDNVGDSIYNKNLSDQRVKSTKEYLVSKGIRAESIKSFAYGEEKPISNNNTDDGKQKNRNVEIFIQFYNKPIPLKIEKIDSNRVTDLLMQIRSPMQEFCIDNSRDTVIKCDEGTLIYIKANIFRLSNKAKSKCINIKVKEVYKKSEMIFENLSTLSNGKLLETQGMFYFEANDFYGKPLNLLPNNNLVIFSPTDKVKNTNLIFDGEINPHDSAMNWINQDAGNLSNFSINDFNKCLNPDELVECPFFFCKIKKFIKKLFGRKAKNLNEIRSSCYELELLLKKYGVSNVDDLFYAMNKNLMDSLNVKTPLQLQDALKKIRKNNIEENFQRNTVNIDDLRYYVFYSNSMGWKNIDEFLKYDKDLLVKLKVDLKPKSNTEIRLIFKDRRIIANPDYNNEKIEFNNIPKGFTAWILAIKNENGTAYFSMAEVVLDNKTLSVQFEKIGLSELKEKMKILDL